MKQTSEASILVTDSGLGGLSVFNRIASQLADNSVWPGVDLTYFNAWPAPMRDIITLKPWRGGCGYLTMPCVPWTGLIRIRF